MMASEIDPFSMLEVSLSVPEKEEEALQLGSLGVDSSSEVKQPRTNMDCEVESLCVDDDSMYLVPLNLGWRREVVIRSCTSIRKADVYYVPPKGKRCRSLKDVQKAILNTDLTLAHFTYSPKILGINDPAKELIRSAKGNPFKRPSLNHSQEAADSPTKKAKITAVNFEPHVTEQISADVTSGLEGTEAEDNEVTSGLESTAVDDKEVTSSVSYEPSYGTNLPSSTSSEPENDPLEAPLQVSLRSCSCGMCSTVDEKSVCCWEVSNIQTVKADNQCITHHPGFGKLILDSDVLSITRHLLSIKTKNRNKKNLLNTDTPLNITWRYIAYKQFVSWVNGCTAIGSRNPVAIPSCVVNAVRERYPEQNGSYKVLKFSS